MLYEILTGRVPFDAEAPMAVMLAQVHQPPPSLCDFAPDVPPALSAAVLSALVKEPKVLLADEPTGNLDEDTRDEIIGLLEKLWQDNGLTLVIVTHDSSIARRAQRLGTMRNGKLTVKQTV